MGSELADNKQTRSASLCVIEGGEMASEPIIGPMSGIGPISIESILEMWVAPV
jgi:hypothetical protein